MCEINRSSKSSERKRAKCETKNVHRLTDLLRHVDAHKMNKYYLVQFTGELLIFLGEQNSFSLILLLVLGLKLFPFALAGGNTHTHTHTHTHTEIVKLLTTRTLIKMY